MSFGKMETKKILGIFDMKLKREDSFFDIVNYAAEYWTQRINLAKDNQIGYGLDGNIFYLSDENILKFKREFINYILKKKQQLKNGIMLWTSDSENFDMMGTDNYLKMIMKKANLPLTCLPNDLCMWIYEDKIIVEENFEYKVIYGKENKIKMDI